MKQNTPIDPPPSPPDWETRMSRTEALVADFGAGMAELKSAVAHREKLAAEDRKQAAADREADRKAARERDEEARKRNEAYWKEVQERDAAYRKETQERDAAYRKETQERDAEARKRDAEARKRNEAYRKETQERDAAYRKEAQERAAAVDKRIADDLKWIADDRKRIAEEHAKLDRKISDEVKRAEGFRDSLARAAEDAFAFRLKDILRDNYGLELDEVLRRVRIVNHGREVDILGLNGSVAVVGEVKIRLERGDVHKFADQLRDFREDFPDHARETVYGVVAGETVDDDAAALARKRGFFVLRMDEGIVCPETPDGFRPRAY